MIKSTNYLYHKTWFGDKHTIKTYKQRKNLIMKTKLSFFRLTGAICF